MERTLASLSPTTETTILNPAHTRSKSQGTVVQTNGGDMGKMYSPCSSPGLEEQNRNTASPCIVIPSAFFLRISVRASYGWMDMMDLAVITLQCTHERSRQQQEAHTPQVSLPMRELFVFRGAERQQFWARRLH